MAQLRAKQIKLSAFGDLLVGGLAGNGEVLAMGAPGTALRVLQVGENAEDMGLAYGGFNATEIAFTPAGDIVATDVAGALVELAGKIDSAGDASAAILAEVDAIEASVGLGSDGALVPFAAGGYAEGKTTFKAAVEAIDAALKAEELARAAVASDLADEIVRATAEEADIRVDFAAADAVVAQDAADALAAAIAQEVTDRDAAILVETNRATGVEADLQDQIDAIVGLSALNFKGEVAGDITSEDLALLAPISGDVYRVITDGATDFAGTGLEVNVGDFVAYTGTAWVKFDNTDPSFTAGNAIVLTGNAHAGYTVGVDNSALTFAALSDVGTPAVGFLKWDGSAMTYVTPAISDITGLQTALDALDAADVANATAISDEEARALAAEGALSDRLDAIEAQPVVEGKADEFVGTDTFELSETPVAGTLVASINGLIVKPSLVTNTAGTVTFGALGYTLDADDEVVFSYSYAVIIG